MTTGRGLFFTGSDTGVGKTYIVAAVARLLRSLGRPVAICKPVATGATLGPEGIFSDDTRVLADAAGAATDLKSVTPWSFEAPVAPAVAARLQGVTLSVMELARAPRQAGRADQLILVEGVGGLLCPLTETGTVADLAAELAWPVIVVTRRSLGTLNHTLLTLAAARERGLNVAGIVVNETEPAAGLAAMTNVAELRRRIGVPLLAVVPFRTTPGAETESILAGVDWWRLSGDW